MPRHDTYQEDYIAERQYDLPLNDFNNIYIIGLGGIGSWVALFVALAGRCKAIHMWDDDVIESTNLNRTPFKTDDVGERKVDAVERLINERRFFATDIHSYCAKFTARSMIDVVKEHHKLGHTGVIIDCRDGVYSDIKSSPYKVYKCAYDGLSLTIDGDYNNRVVLGEDRGQYTATPSFVCPAVLCAVLVVADILQSPNAGRKAHADGESCDSSFMFNKLVTFDSSWLLQDLYLKERRHARQRVETGVL